MTAGKITLIAGAGVLVAGVVLFFVGLRPPPPRTFHGSVRDLLPKIEDLPGWQVEFHPIAATPEMRAKVGETLNFDEAVFAVYTKGIERISIYIAYWTPGKMPHRMVAGHTPDTCWVGAGWKCTEARSAYRLVDGRSVELPAAEVRVMELNGQIEHVAFWHFLDGVPKSYGTRGMPPWYATFTDLVAHRFSQRPEQFFVRISSSHPTETWARLVAFQEIAVSLAGISKL